MHGNYLETTTCWHAPLPLRMWNRFGRVVTLEVCAGVATTLIVTTVPCPHINQVLSLPIGPSRGQDFSERHCAKQRYGFPHSSRQFTMWWVPALFLLSYTILTSLRRTFCGLDSQRVPNLLPVAGGGDAALTLWFTVLYNFSTVLPESYS